MDYFIAIAGGATIAFIIIGTLISFYRYNRSLERELSDLKDANALNVWRLSNIKTEIEGHLTTHQGADRELFLSLRRKYLPHNL